MFQRISIALFTALLSFFAAPLLSVIPASAAPMAQTIVITSDDGQDDKDDKDDKDEDEDDDDDDKDDDDWKPGKSVVVPPTVVTEEDLESDDSSNVAPMQITTDGSNTKTPADTFFEAAMIGLAALGGGALSLGAVAGIKARRAKNSSSEDYFYDSNE